MKKFISVCLLFIIITFLCACSSERNIVVMNDDRTIANKKLDEILEAIQFEDKEKLTLLFSKNSLNNVENFDKTIEHLLNYFDGNVESYDDWGGPYVETSKEDDNIIKIMESSYDIKTTKCNYRIAVRYIAKDTKNIDNVGVQSLYVIKLKDDIDPQCAYWGDGKNIPGITIGKTMQGDGSMS